MLKLKDIFKLANNNFISSLSEMGFIRYGRKYLFIRRHGDFFQVISFLGNRHGTGFYMTIDVWVPNLCGYETISKTEFEKTICAFNLGGNYAYGDIGSGRSFDYPLTEKQNSNLLNSLLVDIEFYVIPWFSYLSKRKVLLKKYHENPKSSLSVKKEIPHCDYQQLENIFPDYDDKKRFLDITLVGSDLFPVEQSTEERFLKCGLQIFIEYTAKVGFEFLPSPRFYLAKKYCNLYHFIEFDFVNSGLFLEVSLSIYQDDEETGCFAHDKDNNPCDIKNEWPSKYYTPISFPLKNSMGYKQFPCYNEDLFKESIGTLINEFNGVYQENVLPINTTSLFNRFVEDEIKSIW